MYLSSFLACQGWYCVNSYCMFSSPFPPVCVLVFSAFHLALGLVQTLSLSLGIHTCTNAVYSVHTLFLLLSTQACANTLPFTWYSCSCNVVYSVHTHFLSLGTHAHVNTAYNMHSWSFVYLLFSWQFTHLVTLLLGNNLCLQALTTLLHLNVWNQGPCQGYYHPFKHLPTVYPTRSSCPNVTIMPGGPNLEANRFQQHRAASAYIPMKSGGSISLTPCTERHTPHWPIHSYPIICQF